MKCPDVNLLIYAIDQDSHHHASALRWWNALLSGSETVALSWAVLISFLRLTTSRRIMEAPLSAEVALGHIDRWLAHPATAVIDPTPRHSSVLRDLLAEVGAAGNLVSDAHLAALAIEHGAELCSADRDFGRFSGLRWINPLSSR